MVLRRSRADDAALTWPKDITVKLLAEGSTADHQLLFLHAERLHRDIPVLPHIDHVKHHCTLLHEVDNLVKVLKSVHLVCYNLSIL